MSGLSRPDGDVPTEHTLGNAIASPPPPYFIILLHTLVTIVLSYELLFTKWTLLSPGVPEMIVVGMIASAVGLVYLPLRAWKTKWLTGALVIVDTLATSSIIYLSGHARSDLYVMYFLIMLLAASAPSLRQAIGLSLALCLAHGLTLFMELSEIGGLAEGHLLQIPILFILAMFYGVATDSARKLSRDKVDLLLHINKRRLAEEENQRTQRFVTSIIDNLPTMLFVKEAQNLAFVRVNKAGEDLLGYSQAELIGKTDYDLWSKEEADFFTTQDREVLKSDKLVEMPERPIMTGPRGFRTLHTKKIPIHDEQGNPRYLLSISEDVTERRQAEEALQIKTEQLEAISESMTKFLEDGDWHGASDHLLRRALRQTDSEFGFMGVVKEGPALRILASEGLGWNPTLVRQHEGNGAPPHERFEYQELKELDNLFGQVITRAQVVLSNEPAADPGASRLPADIPLLRHFLGVPLLHGTEVVGMIGVANRPGGYTGQEQSHLEILMQAAGVLYDSYRRQEREGELEAQLRQSHKMEAIGRLAGGIAHDFNNLLTIIVGHCHFLLDRIGPKDAARKDITEIYEAGERASSLTGQLLAFSRRQMLKPKILDLNSVVSGLEAMLPRLIGEHIDFVTRLDPDLGTVQADPGQLEQVLMNLVINARDAMTDGGTVTIETCNVEAARSHREGRVPMSGRFAMLSVSDTGCGMDRQTQARVFEPFFTTKEQGQGTGLGLATTYGIIKQSGGYIFVDSELGQGTTFKIYLPRVDSAAAPVKVKRARGKLPGGTETILLVEDSTGVRSLMRYALQQKGYSVLEAKHGREALEISGQHVGPIHLLLTDLVMPGLSGPQVVTQLESDRPDMRVLYMSGYSEDMWGDQRILDGEHRMLQKPFPPDVLARTVREVLDG